MLVPLLSLLLALLSPPSDGIRLSGDPNIVEAPSSVPAPARPAEAPGTPLLPVSALAGAAVVLATAQGRRRDPAPGDALALQAEPLVVFVPGHGNDLDSFDRLIDLMDLDDDRVGIFDYRWTIEEPDPIAASMKAPIDDTADALHAYLAGLAAGGRPMYLVGFSKGGAGIAELVSRWDDGTPARIPGVRGAALLDPPISGGLQGEIQSLGRFWGPIPDDGGYDPVQCRWFWIGCTDSRDNLGESSGVETVVIRNPKAGITNFNDHPLGLRVHDAADEGRGPLGTLIRNPLGYPRRVAEAHEALLGDPRVADCITAEIRHPGTCTLPRSDPYVPRFARSGPPGGSVVSRWATLARRWAVTK